MSAWRSLMRPELLEFAPYHSASPARDVLRLHANEAPLDPDGLADGLNRYPLPQPEPLIAAMAQYYRVAAGQVLAVRGSDDGIDLLVRAFCRAGRDSIVVCPPTFGMYKVAATLQDAAVIEVPLLTDPGMQPDVARIESLPGTAPKLVFLCSPNNPTGSTVTPAMIRRLAGNLIGRSIIVVDEAYIEFADSDSVAGLIGEFPNLVVLRTLSKAFGLAGIRCGAVLARSDLIAHLRGLLPPYPLPTPTMEAACLHLRPAAVTAMRQRIARLRLERARLTELLTCDSRVRRVWASQGNFLLVEPCGNTDWLLALCAESGILIRHFAATAQLPDCVRITIGTAEDNQRFVECLVGNGIARHG